MPVTAALTPVGASPTVPTAGPLLLAAVLLAVAGAAKLRVPDGTVRALHAAGIPAARGHGRLLGLVEVVLGASVLLVGGRALAALLAAAYLGFATFTARLLSVDRSGAGCGCFGADDAPVGATHVAVNAALATGCLAAVVCPVAGVADVVRQQPLAGLPFLALVAVGAWAAHLALTALPALRAVVDEVHRASAEVA
ncbi:MAG: DoxX family membrane protein [Actinobacteria bacterium]|nr:DoxX family membrane protein [Actinomycetota bacterium]